MSILVQNSFSGEPLSPVSICPDALGRELLDRVRKKCRLSQQQEIKLHVLNERPVFLQRTLKSQGVVEGTVVTFRIHEKKTSADVQEERRRILRCLSGDGSYPALVGSLTSDQVEEVAASTSSAEDCLRRLLLVADDGVRSSLLELASRRGILETSHGILGVRELLASKVDASSRCNRSALQVALQWARPQVAKALLKASCTVEQTDAHGDTPLSTAVLAMAQKLDTERSMCSKGDLTNDAMLEVVQLILNRGHHACKNQSNHEGETALMRACSENMPKLAKILLGSGCEVSAQDSNGRTALHRAAMKPTCAGVCALLIDARAIVDVPDFAGTSLLVAVKKANAECVELLINAKASVKAACKAEPVFMAAVANCIKDGFGERQRKTLKCLIEADFEFFQSCQEELLELAAEEADTDTYEFLSSAEMCQKDIKGEDRKGKKDKKKKDRKDKIKKSDKDMKAKKPRSRRSGQRRSGSCEPTQRAVVCVLQDPQYCILNTVSS